MSLRFLKNLGPGVLVTAAFIGPGTVTVCTLAGANYGYSLVWALCFATIATIVFQEMASRLGTITQKGLGESLYRTFQGSLWQWPITLLIIIALFAGNSAYQAGNISGAALGAEAITGSSKTVYTAAVLMLAVIAGIVLWQGSYRQVERLLIGLVLFMGISFVGTFAVSQPNWGALTRGMIVPEVPEGSLVTVIALIGTTVVPYNLFLHASAAKARWKGPSDLPAARADATLSIGLGGLVAVLIVSTAAGSLFVHGLKAESAVDMAIQLEPLFGSASKYLLGAGLLAAGFSSCMTAPLATAYAVTEILPVKNRNREIVFRSISLAVLAIGTTFSLSGLKPITVILVAQFANGLLLPIVAGFLLFTMNKRSLLGEYVNGRTANVLGVLVFLVSLGLGARLVLKSLGAF